MFEFVEKTRMVNVRLAEKTHREFKIACDLRGASMSSYLHQFIVRTIREEKEASPYPFKILEERETPPPSLRVSHFHGKEKTEEERAEAAADLLRAQEEAKKFLENEESGEE